MEFRGYTTSRKDDDDNTTSPDAIIKDSVPLGLIISHIGTSRKQKLEQIIVYLRHGDEAIPRSFIKIKLHQNSDSIDMETHLSQLAPLKSQSDCQEVTFNWKFRDVNNKGIFYTDANAYKIVERDTSKVNKLS